MNTTYLVPFFLGTFSGFLATLPIGPAKILAIRKFLLISKGASANKEVYNLGSSNKILLASISGLIFAQILFFLALQVPFLYSLWVKPHLFSVFFISILFIYLYKIKNIQFDIYNTQSLFKSDSNVFYQQAAFFETLLLQLLNPVVLPNPVFFRLTNVFLFRYSTISTFFAGNILGLLGGYGIFYLSTLFLLKRLELDAPTIYRLVKIKIHQFFGIVFVIFSFLCLSRTPLPAIKPFQLKAIPSTLSFNKSWYENIWPDSFFGYDRWKRPLRLIAFDNKKAQPNDETKPFNKMFFSQFFFEGGAAADGKYHLYHNFPQSLAIISQNVNSILKNLPKESQTKEIRIYETSGKNQKKQLIDDWIQEKKNRQNQIYQNINTKINQIEKGIFLEELVEKKFSSFDNNKNKIAKELDPRLSPEIRGAKLFLKNKSFLFLTKEFLSKKSFAPIEKKNLINTYTNNRLKLFLTKNSQNLPFSEIKGASGPLITWKPLEQSSFDNNQNLKEIYLDEEHLVPVEKTSDVNGFKNTTPWDGIFQKISISFSSISKIKDASHLNNSNELRQEDKNAKMPMVPLGANIYKPMPLWNINFNKKELDLIKRQSANKLHLKIFFPKSNHLADRQNFVPPLMPFFRRNEFPGTITSRRGKAVCWNTFQKKPHSPLFINHLSLLKNFFAKQKKIQINQDAPTKSWQPTSRLFQFLRDYLLSLQAYIRKYLKLPFLIIVKNFVRQFFFQPAEWEKDWTNLSKEVYIECDFYGKAVSMGVKLPNFFANDEPKQIKIINPFQLRFWTRSISEKPSIQESENYSFLNVWGRETKMPFGKVKKSPSFWQLLVERIKLILQYKILKKLSPKGPALDPVVLQNQTETDKVQSKYESQQKGTETGSQSKISQRSPSGTYGEGLHLPKGEGFSSSNFKKANDVGPERPGTGDGKNQNSIEKNLKYKTTKRKIITNFPKGPSALQNKTLSQLTKKEKINRTRQYTFKNISLLLERRWFHIYRFFLKKEKELFFHIQKNILNIKKYFVRTNTKILKTFSKLFYNISKILRFLSYRVSEFFSFLWLKFTKNQKTGGEQISSNLDIFSQRDLRDSYAPTKNLSQAYIIHSIWEDRMMSRPNLTSLMKSWNQDNPLKKNLEGFLNEQGILGNEKPENITEHQWKEWLKNFRAYTPSFKLWALCAPNYWNKAVEQYWKDLPPSKLESILNQERNKINKNQEVPLGSNFNNSLENNTLNKFLEPHFPLFKAAQKQKKLWKFNLLSRNYTEINDDGNINSFVSWQTNDFNKKTHFLFDILKKVKGAQHKNLIVSPINLASLPQIKENKLRKDVTQQNIKKELPIIQREKKRFDFDIKLQTLRQRATFFPVSTRRWKLKKLKNKLEKLAKTVIKKPQGGELSSSLTIGEKNKRMIQELFESENRLFANILENWNSKILDDELLMYNTISSILRFGNKNINASLLNSSDSLSLFPRVAKPFDFNFVLLEDVYLPTYLREIRILDCFNFNKENQSFATKLSPSNTNYEKLSYNKTEKSIYAETISKWHPMFEQNQNSMKDRQTIVRFLWPTHRLEDLTCINRFWMGTANQSRFSMLRIQNFPEFLKK